MQLGAVTGGLRFGRDETGWSGFLGRDRRCSAETQPLSIRLSTAVFRPFGAPFISRISRSEWVFDSSQQPLHGGRQPSTKAHHIEEIVKQHTQKLASLKQDCVI